VRQLQALIAGTSGIPCAATGRRGTEHPSEKGVGLEMLYPDDRGNSKLRAALHEAGHAFAIVACQQPVESVKVWRDPKDGFWKGEAKCGTLTPGRGPSPDRFAAIRVVTAWTAEIMAYGYFISGTWNGDSEALDNALGVVAKETSRSLEVVRRDYVEYAFRTAHAFLKENWSILEAIASETERLDAIPGTRVTKIIEENRENRQVLQCRVCRAPLCVGRVGLPSDMDGCDPWPPDPGSVVNGPARHMPWFSDWVSPSSGTSPLPSQPQNTPPPKQ
jgi:hypothetical protein